MKINTFIALITILLLSSCESNNTETISHYDLVPSGPGSMSPNITQHGDTTLIVSWIEPNNHGHELRYTKFSPWGWSETKTVATGSNWFVNWADFPSVIELDNKNLIAHWLESQPEGGYAYNVMLSRSEDSGQNWSKPIIPHKDNTPTEHGFVTLYPDENKLGLIWLDGRNMINNFDINNIKASGMTLRGSSLNSTNVVSESTLIDDLICDCCQTDVAITNKGPVAVYRNRTENEVRDIYVSRKVDGMWLKGEPIFNDNWQIDACPVNGPVIKAHGETVAVIWFTAANDNPRVQIAWSLNSGQNFSDPIIISDSNPIGHVAATMTSTKEVIIGWQERDSSKTNLMLSRLKPNNLVNNPVLVEEADNIFAFSVPQLGFSDNKLIVIWTESIDGNFSLGSIVASLNELGL